jgi:hypothetical protein
LHDTDAAEATYALQSLRTVMVCPGEYYSDEVAAVNIGRRFEKDVDARPYEADFWI